MRRLLLSGKCSGGPLHGDRVFSLGVGKNLNRLLNYNRMLEIKEKVDFESIIILSLCFFERQRGSPICFE
jgi:hypothetical protein